MRPKKSVSLLGLLGLLGLALPAMAQQPLMDLTTFPSGTLAIHGKSARHEFSIWIAATPARQMQGLMFVRELPRDQGMLFVHSEPQVQAMWMKNTYLPLDMLFIDARGRVVTIVANTTPHSLKTLSSRVPVLGVLEIAAGEAKRRQIRIGDRVMHAAFSGK